MIDVCGVDEGSRQARDAQSALHAASGQSTTSRSGPEQRKQIEQSRTDVVPLAFMSMGTRRADLLERLLVVPTVTEFVMAEAEVLACATTHVRESAP